MTRTRLSFLIGRLAVAVYALRCLAYELIHHREQGRTAQTQRGEGLRRGRIG